MTGEYSILKKYYIHLSPDHFIDNKSPDKNILIHLEIFSYEGEFTCSFFR